MRGKVDELTGGYHNDALPIKRKTIDIHTHTHAHTRVQ